MDKKFRELRDRFEEAAALGSAAGLLGWDQRVCMPAKGAEARGKAMAALEKTLHLKFTDPAIGRLIEDLSGWADTKGRDSFEASYLRVLKRDYEKETRLPADFVTEFSLACTAAYDDWVKAKKASDFSIFAPHLEKMVELNLRKAELLAPGAPPYDALLDLYEPGMTKAKLDALFKELLEGLKPVTKAIAAKAGRISDAPLRGDFEEDAQLKLADELVKLLGFDFDRGRQDRSPHPFTGGCSRDDVRITTWTRRDWLPACVYASIHECGHAFYEMGSPKEFEFTPLSGGASLGLHESQSRFWENIIGRSRDFAAWILPIYRKHFPGRFDSLTAEDLYRAANRSEPSLVRVEADEVTYNLHIALRYEMETLLLDRKLKPKDAPELWNAKMKEYLGITPPDDASGILQDVHWSQGTLGYFPTYTLGNLVSAQLHNAMKKDLGDTGPLVRKGEFAPILKWLGEKVHVHGRTHEPEELLKKSLGEEMRVSPFVDYIRGKYSELYGF